MTKVTLDQSLLSKLRHLKEPLELCDGSGHPLGYFTPVPERSLYEGVEVPVSEEELQRAEQDPESYTMEEVLAYLSSTS